MSNQDTSVKDYEQRRAELFADMAALFEFFSYDIEAILERCLEAARHIKAFDEHALLVLKPSGDLRAHVSSGIDLPEGNEFTLEDFYPEEGALYVVNDVDKSSANIIFRPEGEIRSYVTIPLITQDDVLGIFMLGSRKSNNFDDDDLDLFFSLGSHLAVAMENVRQYERAEERLQVLSALQECHGAIGREQDLNKILSLVADVAVSNLEIAAIAIYLFDEESDSWVRRVLRANIPSSATPARVQKSQLPDPISAVLKNSASLTFLPKESLDDLGLFRFAPRFQEIGVLPLHAGNRCLGFMILESPSMERTQMQIIELFSGQVRILFANGILIRNLKETTTKLSRSNDMVREYADKLQKSNELLEARVNELSTLHEVSMHLTTKDDVDETLDFLMKESANVMRADKGVLLLVEGDKLVAKCEIGNDGNINIVFEIGQGIAGHVAKTGKAYTADNISKDETYVAKGGTIREETLLSVPLSIGNRVIGVLSVERDIKFGVFSPEEERLLSLLGVYAARAIEKARHFQDLKARNTETLEAFAQAVDTKDAYTHGHSRRVSYFSREIGRMLRLPDDEMEIISRAALLHDIGKIGISNAILFKTGKLTTEEFEIMKSHVIFGENILKPIRHMAAEAHIVRHHHERWDGRGYPDGLAGEDIPIGSAIICVADAYDTMTSDRPYRKSIGVEKAIEEIQRCNGSQFNPLVVGAIMTLYSRGALKGAKKIKDVSTEDVKQRTRDKTAEA